MASAAPAFTGHEPGRRAFTGGDQSYLKDDQYRDSTNLNARFHLHMAYGTANQTLQQFVSGFVDWNNVSTALECGCGNGRFWESNAARRDTAVTVTDLSPGMADEATQMAVAAGFTDVKGQVCDVQSLPFEASSFDLVAANHMLYHVPNPDLAISELARVVMAGGVVLAATNGHGHMDVMKHVLGTVFGDFTEDLYDVFGIETGEMRLREHFRTVSWHAFDNDLLVTDPDDIVAYLSSYPPGEDATPSERLEIERLVGERIVDGAVRVRTRTGVFVCKDPR